MTLRPTFALVATLAIGFCALPARGAEPAVEGAAPAAIDWFTAMEEGKVDVKFIPRDATEANIIVKNLTDDELMLRLPEKFAAINVQPQMGMGMGGMGGGMGGMGGGMGGMGGGMGMGQGMGGGMGGMGGGMGGMGGMGGGMGMGGMMRVAPERTHKLRVTTVCLEHDKPEPQPRMTYKMVPLDQFNSDPRVGEICKMLGHGRVTQNTAQAAAWHFTDEMDWQELAMKNRVESKYTGNLPFFTAVELRQAMAVVGEAIVQSAEAEANRYAEN